MFVPTLTIEVTDEAQLLVDGFKAAASESRELAISSVGPAAAYALVWELGNIRQHKKGPKTCLGINLMTGEQVWLSTQAPSGYVRVNEPLYWGMLEAALGDMRFADLFEGGLKEQLSGALDVAGNSILELIRQTVPIDSGDLQGSLVLIGDEEMASEEAESIEGATEDQ